MVGPEYIYFAVVVTGLAVATFVMAPKAQLLEPTILDGDGVVCTLVDGELVQADPAELAAGYNMDPNAYALARVLASEAGNLPWIAQIGVGWTVVNHARKTGHSVLAVVTAATLKGSDGAVGDGFFGRQGSPTGGYRYVASSQDTTDDFRSTAESILGGDIDDPTGGALNFDSPGSYGIQAGTDESGGDTFASNREAEGKKLLVLPGTSENQIRFWVPA
jgi:hypothetical protein